MHIILIGNYQLDRQESMSRFAEMLKNGFRNQGIECDLWLPKTFLGKFVKTTSSGFGKWIGYIDKWLIFPFLIRVRLTKKEFKKTNIRFHVCDHSNAPYLRHLPKNKSSITCHDVLAIRGAFGYTDAYCPASWSGKIFQKWILANLSRAERVACDSQATLNQLKELASDKNIDHKKWEVIHCAFNADFYVMEPKQSKFLLQKAGVPPQPFLLHVGSNLKRKNRKLLIDLLVLLSDKWNGNICFAGDPADEFLLNYAEKLDCKNRTISVAQPDHETLVALYNECEAMIFPSFSEGFGWPVIEAQACGVPVIASNIEPMPEISNGTALHAAPDQPEVFMSAFLSLQSSYEREKLTKNGFDNVKRFKLPQMIDSYLKFLNLK